MDAFQFACCRLIIAAVFLTKSFHCLGEVAGGSTVSACQPVARPSWNSWQCLTWALLITVMACILIKSLFTYPGALRSPSGCSGLPGHRRLTGLPVHSLVNADSCSSQPQPRSTWRVAPDMPLNTPGAGATVRNRSIPQGRKTSMSNQQQSAPRVMFFQARASNSPSLPSP